ncbi:MAG: SOS response-associated peptidase family protein [Candidatus Acidiferrales bacterium]
MAVCRTRSKAVVAGRAPRFSRHGKPLKSCTMIITEPNVFVAEVHDRMPVLLAGEDFEP